MDTKDLISVAVAAAKLGISRQRVNILISEGRLPAVRVGAVWMVERSKCRYKKISPKNRNGVDKRQ